MWNIVFLKSLQIQQSTNSLYFLHIIAKAFFVSNTSNTGIQSDKWDQTCFDKEHFTTEAFWKIIYLLKDCRLILEQQQCNFFFMYFLLGV